MPDQTTDHLSEAVEAAENAAHKPGEKMLVAQMKAAEPFFATYYEDKGAEKLLSVENIERAAAKSYEDFRDLNLMPEDPRWADVEDDVKAELRDGIRENVRYALDALKEN